MVLASNNPKDIYGERSRAVQRCIYEHLAESAEGLTRSKLIEIASNVVREPGQVLVQQAINSLREAGLIYPVNGGWNTSTKNHAVAGLPKSFDEALKVVQRSADCRRSDW
jgi:hypothetical protein